MYGIWKGLPAIFCPVTGECVVAFRNNARGFQECIALLKEIQREWAK